MSSLASALADVTIMKAKTTLIPNKSSYFFFQDSIIYKTE